MEVLMTEYVLWMSIFPELQRMTEKVICLSARAISSKIVVLENLGR